MMMIFNSLRLKRAYHCACLNDLLNIYRLLIFSMHTYVYHLSRTYIFIREQVVNFERWCVPRVRVVEVEEPPQLEAAAGIRKGGANAESPPRPPDRRIEFLRMFRYRPQPFRRFSAFIECDFRAGHFARS